jgi:(+)-trans-carveol dehydrogenase
MAGRVEGKVAFITGAARGQGRSHALRLAAEGADIIAVDLCEDIKSVDYPLASRADLDETVRQVEALGRRIVAREADVRDTESLQAAVEAGVAAFGRLDIVSANAGILSNGQSHELSEETWGDMIDINLSGVWRTCKAAIPHMIAGGRGGSIVLTSSVAGLRSYNGVSHYVSAKHGVVGLMKTLAQELSPHSIRVNTVNPTQVDTAMIQNESMYHLFCPDIENPTRQDFGAASAATILLPIDWVESIDVSNAVLFLASDEARYITGVALPIDAGALIM